MRQLPGRIAALVDVVQASPDEARPAILKAAQRPLLQVRLLDAPRPNLLNQREPEIDLLRTRIQAMLSTPRPWSLHILRTCLAKYPREAKTITTTGC